jgi:hypothetical protein
MLYYKFVLGFIHGQLIIITKPQRFKRWSFLCLQVSNGGAPILLDVLERATLEVSTETLWSVKQNQLTTDEVQNNETNKVNYSSVYSNMLFAFLDNRRKDKLFWTE